MRSLMLAFRSILRAPAQPAAASTPMRSTAALHRWLDRAQASGIGRIQAFVEQLRRDVRAVDAAVTTPWSNGEVEGQGNRLKTLKRQMYGRASVELLRARLMPLRETPAALQRE